jgi:hypothetical protein
MGYFLRVEAPPMIGCDLTKTAAMTKNQPFSGTLSCHFYRIGLDGQIQLSEAAW